MRPEFEDVGVSSRLLFHQEPVRSRLRLNRSVITVDSPEPMPNWWRRFWYWALLGWTWEARP